MELKSLNKQDNKMFIVYILKNLYKSQELETFINELKKLKFKNLNFSLSKDVHLPL